MIVEIIVVKTLFDLLMHLPTIIERFQDLIDKTLDLMSPKTLKMNFADLKKKMIVGDLDVWKWASG